MASADGPGDRCQTNADRREALSGVPAQEDSNKVPPRSGAPALAVWANWLAGVAVRYSPLLLLIALAVRPLADVDYWWQIATGRWIVEHGISPVDVFTSSRAGSPRIESSWLYCVGAYLLQSWIGPSGVILVKTAILAATFGAAGLLWRRGHDSLLGTIALSLAVYASHMRFAVRPELITMAALVALLLTLDSSRLRRRAQAGWMLLIQIIWVNSHSMFLLGPAVVACWAVEPLLGARGDASHRDRARDTRDRALVLTLCLAACVVNPYGLDALSVPFHQLATLLRANSLTTGLVIGGMAAGTALLIFTPAEVSASRRRRLTLLIAAAIGIGVVSTLLLTSARAAAALRNVVERIATPDGQYILELRSPFDPLVAGSHTVAGAALVLLTMITIPLARARPRFHQVMLFAATVALALLAVRNLALLSLCAAFIVARSRGLIGFGVLTRWSIFDKGLVAARVGLACVCVGLAWAAQTNRLYRIERWALESGLGVSPDEDYSRTAEFLESLGIRDGFFNTHGAGSFLLERGFTVFVDSRAAAGVLEEVAQVTASDRFDSIDRMISRYTLKAFVVETRYLGLIGRLAAHPNWRLVHADANAVVFLPHTEAPHVDRLRLDDKWLQSVRTQLTPPRSPNQLGYFGRLGSPRAHYRVAWLCMMAGAYGHACDLLEDALIIDPAGFPYFDALAYANAASARLHRAAEIYEIAIRRAPDHARLRMDAARVALGLEDLQAAERHAQRGLELTRRSPESRFVMGSVLLKQRRDAEAVPHLEAAARQVPDAPVYHANLATAYLAVGRIQDAAVRLERAAELDPSDAVVRRDACRVLAMLGQYQQAARWLSEAEKLDPAHPELEELTALLTTRP